MIELVIYFILQSHKLQVSTGDQQRLFEARVVENHDYINLSDLCNLLGLQFVFDYSRQRVVVLDSTSEAIFFLNVSLTKINNNYINLPFTLILSDDEILFPRAMTTSFFTKYFNRLVMVQEIETRPEIKSYKLDTRGDTVVFRFDLEYETETDLEFEGQKVFLEVNGLIPAKKKRTWPGIKLVKEYEVEPFLNYTRFTFKLTDKHIETILRENELLFLIRERPVFDLIVLDPGHGGIDPGAIGKRGLYEKDCNLAISLRLKKLIEDSLNMKVIMTRDEDVYLSLVQRTRIANRNRADLFLSIHCNASRKKKQPCGIETYFLSEAKTDDARSTAALENASIKFDQPEEFDSDLKKILSDIAQTEFLQESSDLAESIQDEAGRLLPIPNRGINQANFYVLNGAYMPAVLVECAFISNPEEEKLLRETKFRNQLAYTIFCGIRKFIKDYNRRLN